MAKPKTSNSKPKGSGFKANMRGKQGSKDSSTKRVNFDNAREDKVVKDIEEGSKDSGRNDIETWNHNPNLLKAAGSLPFATILGDRYGVKNSCVPGVMVLTWSPSLGSSQDPVAFNKAFEAMYSFMVSQNSRNYKYDFPDLAMFVTAGNEVFAALAEPLRIYGLFKAYEPVNRYFVNDVVLALGWDPENFRKNLSKVWFELNDLILQTRQLWIPTTIPLLQRWVDLNSHVYQDAQGPHAQTYVFRRNNYWMLSETASNQGTCLVPATFPTTDENEATQHWQAFLRTGSLLPGNNNSETMTWDQYRRMVQNMIHRLVASQDRSSIYGDLLNAYGKDKIYAFPEFTADYSVKPEFNASILMQIENATVSNVYQAFVFQQQAGILRMTPGWYSSIPWAPQAAKAGNLLPPVASNTMQYSQTFSYGAPDTQILNMHFDGQPTPEAVMEATRFKSGAMNVGQMIPLTYEFESASNDWKSVTLGSDTFGIMPHSSGTEIINSISIHQRYSDVITGGGLSQWKIAQYRGSANNAQPENIATIADMHIQAFDWHPFMYRVNNNWASNTTVKPSNDKATSMLTAYGDFDNYIELAEVELEKLHHTAVFSAFGVPQRS